MSDRELARWEKGLRAAARRDKSALFRDHLRRLDLPDKPELMLEGTVGMLRQLVSYASVDGFSDKFNELLAWMVNKILLSYGSGESARQRHDDERRRVVEAVARHADYNKRRR